MVEIQARDLMEIQKVGRELLPWRIPQIRDEKLNGKHWYLAIMEEAQIIVSQRRLEREAA